MSNLIKSKGTKLLNKQFYKTTYINIIHDDYFFDTNDKINIFEDEEENLNK